MPVVRTMRLLVPTAVALLVAACTETVPVEVVLVGPVELDDVIVCVDGEQVWQGTDLATGDRIAIDEGGAVVEISAGLKGPGRKWAWGSARLDGGKPVRLPLSRVWTGTDVTPENGLGGIMAPRVASAGDGRVVLVGRIDGGAGVSVWDVLSNDPPADFLPLPGADGEGYSVTQFDAGRVLIGWSATSPGLGVLDADDDPNALRVEDSCTALLGQGRHGAGAFFEPSEPGEPPPPAKVLLAGGGVALGSGDRRAVVFDSESGSPCTALTLNQARFAPAVAPYGAANVVIVGGEDEARDPDRETVQCSKSEGCLLVDANSQTNPDQLSGQSATWVRVENSTWILGGTATRVGGTTCAANAAQFTFDDAGRPRTERPPQAWFGRAGHAALPLGDGLPEGGDAPEGYVFVAGGRRCDSADASSDAVIVGFDDAEPRPEYPWDGDDEEDQAIDLGAEFPDPGSARVAENVFLVVGDGPCAGKSPCAMLVNAGPHRASVSPCAVDRSQQ